MNWSVEQLPAFDGRKTLQAVLFTTVAVLVGIVVAQNDLLVTGALVALPIVLFFIIRCLTHPLLGILACLHVNFIVNGLFRFAAKEVTYGIAIDAILFLTLLGIFTSSRPDASKRLHNPVFYILLAWFLFTLLLYFNTEAVSQEAWFYAVRSLSFYWLLTVGCGLMLLRNMRHLNVVINTWLIWSFIAAVWGFKQQYGELTAGEQAWLAAGAAKQHILFGKLRSFSFYSDAGQFGAEMAYAALYCIIRLLDTQAWKTRILYAFLFAVYFWGFAVSGSRGPLFIFIAGFPVYLLLRKNIPLLIVGILFSGLAFGFLKYTYIGQSNYQIQRMRSALSPAKDASFQVRLHNQRMLADYLSTRPLGGGIGSGGEMGMRFAPNTFLARTALDSWYVRVWVDTGVVGVTLHVISLMAIGLIGYRRISRLRHPKLISKMAGLYCGYVGICVASYGNQLFGQHPTDVMMHLSIVFFVICPRIEKQLHAESQQVPAVNA
ncbi:hypothetical protein GCM10027347_56480 [Larkinella harenae]